MRASVRTTILALIALLATALAGSAADWPMWRYDQQRRGVTPEGLSEELHLQWVRELGEPRRAWPFQWDDAGKLDFDVSYEPVAAGTTLLVGSMVSDRVTAYDTGTAARPPSGVRRENGYRPLPVVAVDFELHHPEPFVE